jgi:hypothetical protein
MKLKYTKNFNIQELNENAFNAVFLVQISNVTCKGILYNSEEII